MLGLVGVTLFVGGVAGSYPALFLSGFEPVDVLKGTVRGQGRAALLRRVLVAFQFAISIFLMVVTGIIYKQLEFARDLKLGYDTDRVVVLPGIPSSHRLDFVQARQRWLEHPNILNIAQTSRIPSGRLESSIRTYPEGVPEDERPSMQTVWVGYGFFETLGMAFAAGRSFSSEIASDARSAFVINEAACRELGWRPEEAVGKGFGSRYVDDWNKGQWKRKDGQIIGVVKDVYFEPLQEAVRPMVYSVEPYMAWRVLAKIRSDDIPGTLDFMKEKYREVAPIRPFEYTFLDERFDRLYRSEERQARIFGVFALLAIFVGCLGLFGLASFTAEQRTKEIGIRKVLGASAPNLILLLSTDFTKLVVVANLIAWPFAYYAMDRWLQDFAYRTALDVGTFVLSGAMALLIALATVSYQAVKTSLGNPVDALRYE